VEVRAEARAVEVMVVVMEGVVKAGGAMEGVGSAAGGWEGGSAVAKEGGGAGAVWLAKVVTMEVVEGCSEVAATLAASVVVADLVVPGVRAVDK
jgi:hypothetical protein